MLKKPLVSIIVPLYNSSKYLSRCIDSVIKQEYEQWELILINDGSQDNSYEICQSYAVKDSRILLINKENTGPADSRNKGIDMASGDYIAFVDSDDFINKYMLSTMMIHGEYDIIQCSFQSLHDDTGLMTVSNLGDWVISQKEDPLNAYLCNERITSHNWNKIYKRELFHDIRYPDARMSEDYLLNIWLFSKAKNFLSLSSPLYTYYIHRESVCSQPFNAIKMDILKMGEESYHFLQNNRPELSIYALMYLINYSLILYEDLINNPSEKKNTILFKKQITAHFKEAKKKLPYKDYIFKNKKLFLRQFIFSINKNLYCHLMNYYRSK